MNEEQQKQYAYGMGMQRTTGARMYGAMSVWKDIAAVPVGMRVRMAELVAEYEQGQQCINEAMTPAVQTQLSDLEVKP